MQSTHTVSTARLEAFSDGVIGVIITIMVLELKVPDPKLYHGVEAIRHVMPTLLVYLLSFIQIGIYWVNHHYLIDEVEEASHGLLWANLIFLFCLSLIPFAMLWVRDTDLSPFSISLYSAACLLPAAAYTILGRFVRIHSDQLPHASFAKQALSLVLYLAAVGSGLYRPWIALSCIGAVSVIWLLPPQARADDVHAVRSPRRPKHSNRHTE